MKHITIDEAERAIAGAKKKGKELGGAFSVAILDHGGHLVAFARMDGTFLATIDLAQRKAHTSAFVKMETQDIWQVAKAEGEAHGIEISNGGMITFAGGIPLFDKDKNHIGAIGVSGGSVDQDYQVACAGRDALK
jgi:uncharacterized protein GlcG (DUF336 family)